MTDPEKTLREILEWVSTLSPDRAALLDEAVHAIEERAGGARGPRLRIVDRWALDDQPMLIVDKLGAFDSGDRIAFRNAAAAAGLSGAFLFETEVTVQREPVEPEPSPEPLGEPLGAGAVEVDGERIEVARGTVILSPDVAPLVDNVLTAVRNYVFALTGSASGAAAAVVNEMRVLDERFPHLTVRPGSPGVGRITNRVDSASGTDKGSE